MDPAAPDPLSVLLDALRARHLPRASLSDIRKGIQSLSTAYVERRGRLAGEETVDGPGKRAAFALFYAPLHFLVVRRIVQALGAARPPLSTILDLGCGTGVGGAAWSLEAGGLPALDGVDRSPWAVEEARWTFRILGLGGEGMGPARARRGDAERARFPGSGGAVLAAFAINECRPQAGGRILQGLLRAGELGAAVLVIEPIARSIAPWWDSWSEAFRERGGRADEWRFPGEMPEELAELDRLAGLDHRELTARSLWIRRD